MESSFNNPSILTQRADGVAPSRAISFSPLLCLLAAVVLLSSITPAIKYVFEHSSMDPVALAAFRVTVGFFVLFFSTILWDRGRASDMVDTNTAPLILLGLLGVASYAVAAWGLLHTSVTHYILIYSLMPAFTAILSFLLRTEEVHSFKIVGIVVSFVGCVIAIWGDGHELGAGSSLGDGLVLLFTLMMAAYIVLGSGIAKRVRPLPANTVMFGGSSLMLSLVMVLFGLMGWGAPAFDPISPVIIALVIYVGIATAALFLFRYISQQSLSPVTIGVYHNLVPVFTIFIACLCFDEGLEGSTIVGGICIIVGAELVRRGASIGWMFCGDWQIARDLFTLSTGYRTSCSQEAI
ncbi:MAG TPA: DMT family transporter [Nitrospiraceae bacterium]|nr:DMT family transporter [Nitrospiraceae bacterium]